MPSVQVTRPSDDLDPVDVSCPVCHATGASFFANGSDRLFKAAAGFFRLYRCADCECIFQDPLPEASLLGSFYPSSYWWPGEGQPAGEPPGVLIRMERAYREWVTRNHLRFLLNSRRPSPSRKPESSVLDIGCGSGTFLKIARDAGFLACGLEVSRLAAEIARLEYGLDVRQGAIGCDAWKGASFDFITMFHVLEHLVDPREALEYAAGLLKPEGLLIVQVPNVASWQARLFGKGWYGLDVPRHIINFNPKALGKLFADSGMRILRWGHFSLRDNPAAIASSLAPGLDPVGRRSHRTGAPGIADIVAEATYFSLFLFALPFSLLESMMRRGGTVFVAAEPEARR